MKYVALSVLVVSTTAMVTVAAYYLGDEKDAVARSFACGFLALLLLSSGTYLVIHFRSIHQLEIPDDELGRKEVVWAKTSGSMVYYKSGHGAMFWDTVGGKLFLTNRVLEFRAGAGQPGAYRLLIRLRDIRRARPCKILGFIPGGLRIDRYDGSFELFTFGAAFDVSREWADAIMDFRDDLEDEQSA